MFTGDDMRELVRTTLCERARRLVDMSPIHEPAGFEVGAALERVTAQAVVVGEAAGIGALEKEHNDAASLHW